MCAGTRNISDKLESIYADIDAGTLTEDVLASKAPHGWVNALKKEHPRSNYDSDGAWAKALIPILDELDEMLLDQTLKKYRAQEKEESPDGFCLDREQSFDERIDAAIARDIKVLGQIKTMKAIGSRQTTPPSYDRTAETN
jgi:hypothetical protein